MKLIVIGTGSKGNGYILENDNEALIIEAGMPLKEVKIALDFNVSKIVGLIASHSHFDHIGHISEYEKAGIKIYKPFENFEKTVHFGGFTINAFDVPHSVPCYGFLIRHKDMGKLVFATDCELVRYTFKDVNHILIEANYMPELIQSEDANYEHRVLGHMAIGTTVDFLKANDNPLLRDVMLIHLSDTASDEKMFTERAQRVVDCPVYVADKNMQICLSEVPF